MEEGIVTNRNKFINEPENPEQEERGSNEERTNDKSSQPRGSSSQIIDGNSNYQTCN